VKAFDLVEIKKSLKLCMELGNLSNGYLQEQAPWTADKLESGRSKFIIFVCLNVIKLLSVLFEPFMPSLSAKINYLLGFPEARTSEDETRIEIILQGVD